MKKSLIPLLFIGSFFVLAGCSTTITLSSQEDENKETSSEIQDATYSITYHPDGGVNDESNPNTYTYLGNEITLNPATKTGYIFDGWFKSDVFNSDNKVTTIPTHSEGDLDLYAKWIAKTYAITFEGHNKTVTYNEPLPILDEEELPSLITGYTFKGYYDKEDGAGTKYYNADGTSAHIWNKDDDATLYPSFNANVYDITYHDQNNEPFSGEHDNNYQTSHTYGIATVLDIPSKDGYTFDGYFIDKECSTTPISTLGALDYTSSVSLYAKWSAINYTIAYDLDGGELDETNPTSYYIFSDFISLNNPTKDHYEFIGWTGTGLEEATLEVIIPSGSIGNRSYKANWTSVTYNIEYDLAGGSATNQTTYNIESNDVQLNNPTKDHYDFSGWTGTGLSEPTMEVTIPTGSTGNRYYQATWSPTEYTINYVLNGGNVNNQTTYNIESSSITLNNPTRAGYTFIGWTGTDLETATINVTIPECSYGERTYEAHWSDEEVYTIAYDLDGGNAINPSSYKVTTPTFTLNNPTKLGYEFIGWTGTGLSEPTMGVTILVGSSGSRNYVANWNKSNFTIAYNLDGGSATNPTSYSITTDTFALNNPTKTGYNFVGWTGTDLNEQTMEVTIPSGSTGNREFLAHWSLINYEISYNLDGGSISGTNPANYNIESSSITLKNPTKTGYNFVGWTGTDLNEQTMEVTIPTGSTGARSYVAHYEPIVVDVSFTGLGVNETLHATYGVGLDNVVPVPTYDIYNVTYSTGETIDYTSLLENATVTYSVVDNGGTTYSGGSFILSRGAQSQLYETEGSFAISANFTAVIEGSYSVTNAKLGYTIYDKNGEWLAINLFDTNRINFYNSSSIDYGWNNNDNNTMLFYNLDPVFSEINPNFTFKLIFDAEANCFELIFNENTSEEQYRLIYVERINEITGKNYDFSSARVGLFNHSWGLNGCYTTNVVIDKYESSIFDTTYYRTYEDVERPGGEGMLYLEKYRSSSSFKMTADFNNQWCKPGVRIQDANCKSFIITSWDNPTFYIIDYDDRSSNPNESAVPHIKINPTGTIKDDNHHTFDMKVIYDYENEVFYFKVDSIKEDNVYTVTTTFKVTLKDIQDALGVDYDLSSYRVGPFTHGWGGSVSHYYRNISYQINRDKIAQEILEIEALSYSDKNYDNNKYTFTSRGHDYLPGANQSIYLKTRLNINNDHQGITIQVGDQNAQIGFQHKGYSVLENYGWDVPDKLDGNAFKYNNLLGAETANHGEHVVEYFIYEGKLYVAYDGNNLVSYIQLTLSEINDAFTPNANYQIGINNYEGNFEATILDYKIGLEAINEYNKASSLEPINNKIDIYLIAGQSNAAGYSLKGGLDGEFSNVAYAGATDFFMTGSRDYRSSYIDSYTDYAWSVTSGLGADKDYIGPEYGMAKILNSHYSGDTKALIFKTAAGGTSLRDVGDDGSGSFGNWYPRSKWEEGYTPDPYNAVDVTGVEYYLFVENFRNVYNELVANGYSPTIKGMAWMQGCADLGYDDEYEPLLRALINDVRNDLSEITGDDLNSMPFVIGKIATTFGQYSGTYNPYVPSFNDMQQHVADTMDNVYTIETSDLLIHNANNTECLGTDHWHFSTNDAVKLGERFADALIGDVRHDINFKKPDGTLISTSRVADGASITFPTDWVDEGYQVTGWKLNNEGSPVTSATSTIDADYYAVVEPISVHVHFTGLGVDEDLEATYGIGLNGSEPTPTIDIYNTTYSTGSEINYKCLLNDATATYSLVTNNASYDATNNSYTLYIGSYAELYNSKDSFSISADFTASGETKTYSKLGYYLVDANNKWLGIDLFGTKVINFNNESYANYGMGYNSDGQGLFNDLNDVYSEDNPNFTFKLVYDASIDAFYLIFNEGTPNEQHRIIYVSRINDFIGESYDFSTAQVGLYNHGWGINGCTASNVTFTDSNETIYADYYLFNVLDANYGVTNNGDGTYSITNNNASYAMDATNGSFSVSATFAQNGGTVVNGFRLYDKNHKSIGFYDWGGSTYTRFWVEGDSNSQPTNDAFMPGSSGTNADTTFTIHLQYDADVETFTVWDVRDGDSSLHKFSFTLAQLAADGEHGSYDFSKIYICLGSGSDFGNGATVSNYSFTRL